MIPTPFYHKMSHFLRLLPLLSLRCFMDCDATPLLCVNPRQWTREVYGCMGFCIGPTSALINPEILWWCLHFLLPCTV